MDRPDVRAFWHLGRALRHASAGPSFGDRCIFLRETSAFPDFIFYLVPVPFYLLYWRLSHNWRRSYTWFTVTLGLMLVLFIVHFFFYSFGYTLDLYHNKLIDWRREWRQLLLALFVLVPLLVIVDRLYPRVRPLWLRAASLGARYRWVWAGALILL